VLGLLAAAGCGDEGPTANADGSPPPVFDAAPRPDATDYDGAVLCGADYSERRDGSNDPFEVANGTVEGTSLTFSSVSVSRSVCGNFRPDQANDAYVDGDFYSFVVAGDNPQDLRVVMSVPDASPADNILLRLYRVDAGTPILIGSARYRRDYAMTVARGLEQGQYWLGAVAEFPARETPLAYTLELTHDYTECAVIEEAPDYTEADDGGGSRGNDTVAIAYPEAPQLTSLGGDSPETTGLTLTPQTPLRLSGQSGLVASAGDNYLDRDAFLITTAADTTELELVLTWADADVDLDVYVFAPGDPPLDHTDSQGVGISDIDDEVAIVNVDPASAYWIWVGAYDTTAQDGATALPMAYDLTLCPRTHGVSPTR